MEALQKKWNSYRHINDEGKAYTVQSHTEMMVAMRHAQFLLQGSPTCDLKPDELINLLDEKYAALVQVCDPASTMLPLWNGDHIPDLTGGSWRDTCIDGPAFIPNIVPFLHNDGEKRPAIVVTAGGIRGNVKEGFPYARYFFENGYNAFVVNHRIDRNSRTNDNFALDYQRAIRMVRNNAQEWGIDKNHIAGIGSSMGGVVWVTFIENIRPGTTPDMYDSSYVCDEVDKEDDRLNAGMGIYTSSSPNRPRPEKVDYSAYPPIFWILGSEDAGLKFQCSYLNELIQNGVHAEIRLYDGAVHGFGLGDGSQVLNGVNEQIDEVATWPEKALLWLKRRGF